MTLVFRVFGVAQQMGSKRAFTPKGWTRPVITDSNRNLKAWQQLVAEAANHALEQLPDTERVLLTDGVRLTVTFFLPRPESLPKRVTAHIKAPDLDKLVRGAQDAMTQVVFRNDAQICELLAVKKYAKPGDTPYAEIRVEATTSEEAIVVPPAPLPLLEAVGQ